MWPKKAFADGDEKAAPGFTLNLQFYAVQMLQAVIA